MAKGSPSREPSCLGSVEEKSTCCFGVKPTTARKNSEETPCLKIYVANLVCSFEQLFSGAMSNSLPPSHLKLIDVTFTYKCKDSLIQLALSVSIEFTSSVHSSLFKISVRDGHTFLDPSSIIEPYRYRGQLIMNATT